MNNNQLTQMVDRLTSPTRASMAWHHNYDAQETHVQYLRKRDPRFQPQRSVSPKALDTIVIRLTRPTTASTAACWNFDHQDANLAYLKKVDHCIQIPFRSKSVASAMEGGASDSTDGNTSSTAKSRISVNDLPTSRTANATPKNGFWATCGRSVNPRASLDSGRRQKGGRRSRNPTRDGNQSWVSRDESPGSSVEGDTPVHFKSQHRGQVVQV